MHYELYRNVAGLTGTTSPWPTSLTSLPSFQAAGFSLNDLPPSSLVSELCQVSEKLAILQEELHTLKANGGEGALLSEAEGTVRSVSPPPLGSPPPTSCGTSTHPHSMERLSFGSNASCYSSGSNAYFPRMLMETESEEVQQSLLEMLQGRHALGTQVSIVIEAAPWLDGL